MKYKKQPTLKKTGAFALLDNLVKNGTKHIFGYPGGAILPIYDELYRWEQQNLISHFFIPFNFCINLEYGTCHSQQKLLNETFLMS